MFHDDDPARLSADERLGELAGILAEGVLRLHSRRVLPPVSGPQNHAESGQDGLEVPRETVLSVHTS